MDRNKQQPDNSVYQDQEQNTQINPEENKIAQNPNPRTNENISQTPFEKENDGNAVGSEITDGEAG